MSKVNLNESEFEDVSTHIVNASDYAVEVSEEWGENFDNLYNNIVTSGFLNDLYEDAKSQFDMLLSTGCSVVGGASLGALVGSFIPGIGTAIGAGIGAIVGGLFGAGKKILDKSSVRWSEESKKVFENDLLNCQQGSDDKYAKIYNIDTKIKNVNASLLEILYKINEFQKLYSSLEEAASEAKVQTKLADDGVTLLGVDTTITIDGQSKQCTVSEAMNAFFTYESTVMSSEFEAQILHDKYGIDVDYNAIVKNANSFMASTIDSQLYTHEYVEAVLPNYNADFNSASSVVANGAGLTTDTFTSVLSQVPGALGSSAGLLGAAFLGTLVDNSRNNGSTSNRNVSSGSTSGRTTSSGSTSGGSSSNGGNSSSDSSEAIGVLTPVDDNNPDETPSKPNNDVDMPEITETELPEKVEVIDEIVNYDDLARAEYESKGSDSIDKYREEIIDAINEKFDSGDLDPIKSKLKEYGYSDSDIENIIKDRQSTITAIIAGDEKQELAKIAKNLAKNDGVNDYNSIYEENNSYNDTIDGTLNTTLVNMNENEELVSAREDVTKAYDNYKEKVNIANESIAATSLASSAVTKAMDEYSNKYNTQDTSQWDQAAAEDYANLVNKYNESVKVSESAIKDVETAKSSYEDAGSKYSQIKEEFLNNVKKENDRTDSFKDSNNADNSIYDDSDDDKSDNNSNGNISSNDSSVPSDNVSSGTTINISDDDLLNLINPSGDNSSINF